MRVVVMAPRSEQPQTEPASGEDSWSFDAEDLRPSRDGYEPTAGFSDEDYRKATGLFALILLAMAAFGFILQDIYPSSRSPDLSDCVQIENPVSRLTCYDKVAEGSITPAKGIGPPLVPLERLEQWLMIKFLNMALDQLAGR
jgi:hypothetical protein